MLFKNELFWYFHRFGCFNQVVPWVKAYIESIVAFSLVQAGVAFRMQFCRQDKPRQAFLGFGFSWWVFLLNCFVAVLLWEITPEWAENKCRVIAEIQMMMFFMKDSFSFPVIEDSKLSWQKSDS